ncbi:focadhesin isoform X1 [Vanessa tameamea]|uniref:Focadhesin isoform X1 n=1 Tax=Vanessa tameamea TaxID=334116 RepID=A0A8B8I6C0_VANTA
MDEIEYKLKTNNSILIVNAIDKLLSTIKSKYKPGERPKFVLENEELKYLRDKCASPDNMVSLTACQGLLALVELGVLEIAHTMSTVVTLLPSTHNYSAIISTMAGLLVLDLKSRLIPGQQYKCQFSLKSPQHPFITVLEKNKDAEDDVLAQMHALCTHPEYTIASNSLELLRSVFLWLTCSPHRSHSIRPWQLLLSLPQSDAQSKLLLSCISCQQVCNPKQIEQAYAAYSAVTDAAIYQQRREHVVALMPMLARVCAELVTHGRDPRGCYSLIERCCALDAPELKTVAGFTVMLLAQNLINTSALYLHELFNLCLNIISKYEFSSICLNSFVGLSLQWLHLPSYLTNNALKVASKIVDIHQESKNPDTGLLIANLKSNATFQALVHVDKELYVYYKLLNTWERLRDNEDKLKSWIEGLMNTNEQLKLELLTFFIGIVMDRHGNLDIVLKCIRLIIDLVRVKKEVSVTVLPVLLYKIANDVRPGVKLECLKGLPLMATTKENVPALVAILNKLKVGRGVPISLLIMLYTSLAETQARCFPYLQETLSESSPAELKWELDAARAQAVLKICELRPSSNGLELVSVISSLLTRCSDRAGAAASSLALAALARLWRAAAVAPPGAWRAIEPRLARDSRPAVQLSLCKLLSEIPALRVPTAEFEQLVCDTARRLWQFVAEADEPAVLGAACDALALYRVDDYKLKDIPEIYRRTVKLPPSYCKTPADAARKPEDVLDYVPCEVWPEVFKNSNQIALPSVQRLVSKLMEREIKSYRSGVYGPQAREPPSLAHLPPASVVRGLMECFRRQATSPSYDYPEAVLLAILHTLSADYPKPLPPLDFCFLHEVFHRGYHWKAGCVKLAARQASTSVSAKRLIENFLQSIVPGRSEESDIMLFFENLPIFCRTVPPNNIRTPLENCLTESFYQLPKSSQDPEELLFIKQMRIIKECLESDRIHDANRTLLSQIVENYFSALDDDHLVWPVYLETCAWLPTKHLERMTSPAGWWEVSGALLRRAARVRAALAARGLVWLNELVDAHAACPPEQENFLRCILPALQAAKTDEQSTTDWFLQLLARTQVAFNETEDEAQKLFLCDVFFLSVVVFSGFWSLEPDAARGALRRALPGAAAALVGRHSWRACALPLLEWLCHTRDTIREPNTAHCCQRALLALRHTEQFTTQKIWMRMQMNYGKTAIALEDSEAC